MKSTTTDALELSTQDQALLAGHEGEGLKFAMENVVAAARAMGAPRLIDASFVHIDACHYYGTAHLDFARFFVERGVRFDIPAWTNTVPVSLTQPELRDDADPRVLSEARELADLYLELGATPVWTCAPYQLPQSPGFGEDIVGSESNAVTYYNSVVGARTNKYGDFLDVSAGLVKRVPCVDLHTESGRRGEICFDIKMLPEKLRRSEMFCHVLGVFIGKRAATAIPVIDGLPADTHADSLKAISAASAAAGGVRMFHAIGVTPEAPTWERAFHGRAPRETIRVTPRLLLAARDSLSSCGGHTINTIALGTPHFSFTEFERLATLLDGRRVHSQITFYVSTARHIADLVAMHDWGRQLEMSGIQILVDTCTYFSPAVRACTGRVMTNSAKWAYYAPGMLNVDVAFGSLEDCVESAVAGELKTDDALWQATLQSPVS